MPTERGLNPDCPLPLFLADELEPQGMGKAWDRVDNLSRVLKASVLVATATAIGIALLSAGNPVTLFADVTASLVDKPAIQPETDRSAPTIQSTADAQVSPPPANDAPTRDVEIAVASESDSQSQMEKSESSSEALFRQFQAWAVDRNAQEQVGLVQFIQNASARVAENSRSHRHARPIHSARAETRPVQNPRKKMRREQNARMPSAQYARALEQPVQNAPAPSFLETLGRRY
jgi:hypothetical protein